MRSPYRRGSIASRSDGDRRQGRSRRLSRRLPVGILAVTIGLAGTTTIALAHGGGTSKIHSCVTKIGGVVRIVEASNNCLLTESPLDWNAQGPAGPQGAVGSRGPAGPQGPQGPAGADAPKTIAGRVSPEGTVLAGSGFTAAIVCFGGECLYTIEFPPGTWDGITEPVLVATSESFSLNLSGGGGDFSPDGSATHQLLTGQSGFTQRGAGFSFHVTQS